MNNKRGKKKTKCPLIFGIIDHTVDMAEKSMTPLMWQYVFRNFYISRNSTRMGKIIKRVLYNLQTLV